MAPSEHPRDCFRGLAELEQRDSVELRHYQVGGKHERGYEMGRGYTPFNHEYEPIGFWTPGIRNQQRYLGRHRSGPYGQ